VIVPYGERRAKHRDDAPDGGCADRTLQGEAGVLAPHPVTWGSPQACGDAAALLIADEIQSGWLALERCRRWTTKVSRPTCTPWGKALAGNPAGFCCRRSARGARSAAAWRARIDVRR
jgi:acetylornithine/succinyldiaminopimelate/putrescine aminotransferase